MIILWYIALGLLLFLGSKAFKKKEWNEGNMSFEHTKSFLGFCAVIIVFHHLAQATCASWLDKRYIRHGLDIFVTAGYPMVAMFFFCSGFGMYKSAKAKPGFFKRFIPVRIIPILIPTGLTMLVYILFRYIRKIPFNIDPPLAVNAHETWHPYIWYIPCIILMYLLFYVGFGLFKKDWIGITVVALGIIAYAAFCIVFRYGTWWFNTPHMFLMGILFAKYEQAFFARCQKLYPLKLTLTIIACVILWFLGNSAGGIYLMIFNLPYFKYAYICDLITCIFQVLYTFAFVSLYYLLSMKIRIGNPVLSFLGKFTLELYLIHGVFIHMFGYYMIKEGVAPVHYIANVPLFVLVVLALSIPVSFAVSLLDKKVGKALRPKENKRYEK